MTRSAGACRHVTISSSAANAVSFVILDPCTGKFCICGKVYDTKDSMVPGPRPYLATASVCDVENRRQVQCILCDLWYHAKHTNRCSFSVHKKYPKPVLDLYGVRRQAPFACRERLRSVGARVQFYRRLSVLIAPCPADTAAALASVSCRC
jgi:hypothetical protein